MRAHVLRATDVTLRVSGPTVAMMHRHKQHLAAVPQFKEPATKDLLRDIMGDASVALVVKVAVLLAWFGMLRVSEYVSDFRGDDEPDGSGMRLNGVKLNQRTGGYAVHCFRGKRDRYNTGFTVHYTPTTSSWECCPVRMLSAYLQHAVALDLHHYPSAPLLIHDNGGYVTRADISKVLKDHAEAVGLPAQHISTHSLRIGAAFALADKGIPWLEVVARARWSAATAADMYLLYCRISESRLCKLTASLDLIDPVSSFPLLSLRISHHV